MTRLASSAPWWTRLPRFLRPPRPVFMRHPVSATRSRTGWALLAVLASVLGAFAWTTSDEHIRRRAERFLESATHGEVSVRSARFSMFDGIMLRGVRIATPATDGAGASPDERQIFSAESVTLYPNPWKLLLLKLDVNEIAAVRPEFSIVQDLVSRKFNWEQLRAPAMLGAHPANPVRPHVRLRDAAVHTATVDGSGRKSTGLIVLDVDVSPQPENTSGFRIDIRKHSDKSDRVRMIYDPLTGSISDTPDIGLGSVRPLLPIKAQEFFERIGLEGEISSRSIRYGTTTQPARHFELDLKGVQLALPYSMLGNGTSESAADAQRQGSPVIQLTGIDGGIKLSDANIDVDLHGRLNDVPCNLKGSVAQYDLALDEIGLDLEFSLSGLMMPEGEARRRLLADESAPFELRDFLSQYDPYGPLDLRGRLVRRAGGGDIQFTGDLVARCRIARFREFPYPIEGASGTVRFRPDGEWVDGIVGRRGSATIRIDGHVDNMHLWTGYDVLVTATAVPMNSELYDLLDPGYQRLWRRFDLRGLLDTRIRVWRPNGDATGSRKFRTTVAADFRDARVQFDQFPYPLDSVRGQLNVEPGIIRIDGLTGRGGPPGVGESRAVVRVDGYYLDEDPQNPASPGNLELRLEARNLGIDRQLIDAMPLDARVAFEQLRPSGRIDLLGRVFTSDAAGTLNFDLDADVRDAAMCYSELPYSISGMNGRVRISPDRLTVLDLTGSHGTTGFAARGEVRQTDRGYDAELNLSMTKLALDEDFRKAVSGELKSLWEMLDPAGVLDLSTKLHRFRVDERTTTEHTTTVELRGASIRYREFPLPLSELRGVVRATEKQVEFLNIAGRCGKGEVTLSGTVDLAPEGPSGKLRVHAGGMRFDDALTSTLPAAIRDACRAVGLRGGFGLELSEFAFRPDGPGRTEYSWSGDLLLHDVLLSLGLEARDVNGGLHIDRATYGARGLRLQGGAALTRAVFGQFDLRNLRFDAQIKDGSNALELTNARAELFGGTASGGCTIRFLPNDTQYELSFDLRDAELQQYLRATKRLSDTQQAARGLLYGKFAMRGLTSRPNERRGGGELFLREAQVWKLPLILKIFQLLNLAPDENMFHDGWLKFFIEGNTMHLTKIDLQGGAISLIGGGELNIDTDEINVRLLAGSPHRLRVPIVTEMIEGASRDLFELHITGSLRDPKIETQQARNIRRALETIFPPPPANRGQNR